MRVWLLWLGLVCATAQLSLTPHPYLAPYYYPGYAYGVDPYHTMGGLYGRALLGAPYIPYTPHAWPTSPSDPQAAFWNPPIFPQAPAIIPPVANPGGSESSGSEWERGYREGVQIAVRDALKGVAVNKQANISDVSETQDTESVHTAFEKRAEEWPKVWEHFVTQVSIRNPYLYDYLKSDKALEEYYRIEWGYPEPEDAPAPSQNTGSSTSTSTSADGADGAKKSMSPKTKAPSGHQDALTAEDTWNYKYGRQGEEHLREPIKPKKGYHQFVPLDKPKVSGLWAEGKGSPKNSKPDKLALPETDTRVAGSDFLQIQEESGQNLKKTPFLRRLRKGLVSQLVTSTKLNPTAEERKIIDHYIEEGEFESQIPTVGGTRPFPNLMLNIQLRIRPILKLVDSLISLIVSFLAPPWLYVWLAAYLLNESGRV